MPDLKIAKGMAAGMASSYGDQAIAGCKSGPCPRKMKIDPIAITLQHWGTWTLV
jgi:hypothetical protein